MLASTPSVQFIVGLFIKVSRCYYILGMMSLIIRYFSTELSSKMEKLEPCDLVKYLLH